MSTDLVKPQQTPAVIHTPEEFTASLDRWRGAAYHVLTPFATFSGLAPSHGILTSMVRINTDEREKEIYTGLPFLKKGEAAIAKNGLRKIAEGLGVSTQLQYISTGNPRHYWHVKAIASYRGIDGSIVTREASLEWDLRDGSDRLKGWSANQISEARKHGLRACETRAINAAIRECGCGIRQAYTIEELQRPFVTARVMFQPDLTDPETRRLVTEQALRGTNALYAGNHQPESHDAFIDADVVDDPPVGSGQSAGAQASSGQAAAPTFLRVTKVESKSGETNGRKWTLFTVTFSDQVDATTFDTAIAERAKLAQEQLLPVKRETVDTDRGTNLASLSIVSAAEPELPLEGGMKL